MLPSPTIYMTHTIRRRNPVSCNCHHKFPYKMLQSRYCSTAALIRKTSAKSLQLSCRSTWLTLVRMSFATCTDQLISQQTHSPINMMSQHLVLYSHCRRQFQRGTWGISPPASVPRHVYLITTGTWIARGGACRTSLHSQKHINVFKSTDMDTSIHS